MPIYQSAIKPLCIPRRLPCQRWQKIKQATHYSYLKGHEDDKFNDAIRATSLPETKKYYLGYQGIIYNFPNYLFFILIAIISVYTFIRDFSIIQVLGLMSCFYLMTELGYTNWLRFLIWLVVGLVIYICYSYEHSLLGEKTSPYHKSAKRIASAFMRILRQQLHLLVLLYIRTSVLTGLFYMQAWQVRFFGFLLIYVLAVLFLRTFPKSKIST